MPEINVIVEKVIKALKKHAQTNENIELESKPKSVMVSVMQSKIIGDKNVSVKKLYLPFPANRNKQACLIVKDNQSFYKQFVKDNRLELSYITKVIDIEHLRKNYKDRKDRETFVHSFDVFLADKRIVEFVPSILGRPIIKSGKIPIPVKVSSSGINIESLNKAFGSTKLILKQALYLKVRVADINDPSNEIVENVLSTLRHVQKYLLDQNVEIAQVRLSYSGGPDVTIMENLEKIEDVQLSTDE